MTTPDSIRFVPSGDPLIDEVRAIRHKLSAEFGHDVNRLVDHLREIERQHPSRVLQPGDLKRRPKT